MRKEELRENWKRLRDAVKIEWDRLTEEDLDEIAGERTLLVGKVEQRYDVTRENADRQVRDWQGRVAAEAGVASGTPPAAGRGGTS